MRRGSQQPTIQQLAIGALLLLGANAWAADYVVTADLTKVRCNNGQDVIVEANQVLQVTGDVDRGTYRVRLPSPLARYCADGEVSSMAVYNVGALGDPPVSTPAPRRESPSHSSRRAQVEPLEENAAIDDRIRIEEVRSSLIEPDETVVEEPTGDASGVDESVDEAPRRGTGRRARESQDNDRRIRERADSTPTRHRHDQSQGGRRSSDRREIEPRENEPAVEIENESNIEAIDDGSVLRSSRSANTYFKQVTRRMAPQCRTGFLGRNDLGPWGEYAKEIMSIGFFEDTLDKNSNAFSRVCPGYSRMTVEQKKNLVLLTIIAQANFESSCSPQRPNYNCPNGVCRGLFQLHQGKEDRYVQTREFKKYCPRNASMSAEKSISCVLAMFMEDMWQGESIVGNRRSYWEVLAPQYGNSKVRQFRSLIGNIPDCQRSALASSGSRSLSQGRRARDASMGRARASRTGAPDSSWLRGGGVNGYNSDGNI